MSDKETTSATGINVTGALIWSVKESWIKPVCVYNLLAGRRCLPSTVKDTTLLISKEILVREVPQRCQQHKNKNNRVINVCVQDPGGQEVIELQLFWGITGEVAILGVDNYWLQRATLFPRLWLVHEAPPSSFAPTNEPWVDWMIIATGQAWNYSWGNYVDQNPVDEYRIIYDVCVSV